ESRSNDSIPTATALPMAEDPPGSGFWTSAIALGTIDPAGDNDYWSFAAKAGDKLSFDLEHTGGDGPQVIISNAAGGTIWASTSGGYSWFGTPSKTTPPREGLTIPADGTYYLRILNWPGYGGTWSYQARVDLGRGLQLEIGDWNFENGSVGGAVGLPFSPGAAGHQVGSVGGSLYTQDGLDYYRLGRLDPGNKVTVSSRTISVSGLTYKVQVVGGVVGLLPDQDGSQLDNKATVNIQQSD